MAAGGGGGRARRGGALAALAALRGGEVPSLVLLLGPDGFLREEFLRAIRAAVLVEGAADFNHDRMEWPETGAAAVAAAAQTLPFMAPRRLVEVHRFESVGEGDARVLMPLVEAPPETATVVFTAATGDMRTRLLRKIGEAGGVFRMETPPERELPAWLRAQAEGLGFELAHGAALLLVDTVAPSLGRLRAELEKLAAYVGPGGKAGEEEVSELIGRSKVEAMFKLGDALAGGEAARALALVRRLLESEAPQMMVGMLRSQLRRWTMAKAALRRGRRGKDLAALIGVPPFAAARIERQVGGVSATFLRGLYGKLLEADRILKRTSEPRRMRQALELFVMESARGRGGFSARSAPPLYRDARRSG